MVTAFCRLIQAIFPLLLFIPGFTSCSFHLPLRSNQGLESGSMATAFANFGSEGRHRRMFIVMRIPLYRRVRGWHEHSAYALTVTHLL